MRKNYLQLPKQDEIKAILEAEADRKVSSNKRDEHFVDFSSLVDLMKGYGISTEVLERKYDPKAVFNQTTLDSIANKLNILCEKILNSQPNAEQKEKLDASYEYLAEQDEPQKSDLIFVFGSKARYRTEKAIELYKAGFADTIMFSGNKAFYEKGNEKPQIYRHAKYAQENGVSKNNIIFEDNSITVADNVKRSLNLLEDQQIPHRTITLVMSPFAQRRGYAHFQKFSSQIKLWRVNSESSGKFHPENWYEDKVATRVVMNEWAKMRFAQILNTI